MTVATMLRGSMRLASQSALRGCSKCAFSSPSASISTTAARTTTWKVAANRRVMALTSQHRAYATSATESPPDPSDNFLSGSTANYIDEMYMQWKQDPKSVHVSWQVYFKNMESGEMPIS